MTASAIASALIAGAALYAAAGAATALAFLASRPWAQFTLGARAVLVPGVVALWPYVIRRWIAARAAR